MLLMVPVGIMAALVAMAGPQRLTATSSAREISNDLALFAAESFETTDRWMVSLRFMPEIVPNQPPTPLTPPLPMDCRMDDPGPDGRYQDTYERRIEQHVSSLNAEINRLDTEIAELNDEILLLDNGIFQLDRMIAGMLPTDPELPLRQDERRDKQAELDSKQAELDTAQAELDTAQAERGSLSDIQSDFGQMQSECERFVERLSADLGNLGVDIDSMRGYYNIFGDKRDPEHWTQPLCSISDRQVGMEAVRVAVVATWHNAGWAAAQVWPEGARMAIESVGIAVRHIPQTPPPPGQAPLAPPALACRDLIDAVTVGGFPRRAPTFVLSDAGWSEDDWHTYRRITFSG